MKIRKFIHEGVLPDGKVLTGGAVSVSGGFRMSRKNGGCDLEGCHCSDGHWLTLVLPRTDDGIVEGITVKFDNVAEMKKYLIQV